MAIYLGTAADGIKKSTDGGATWTTFALSGKIIRGLALDGDYLYAAVEGAAGRCHSRVFLEGRPPAFAINLRWRDGLRAVRQASAVAKAMADRTAGRLRRPSRMTPPWKERAFAGAPPKARLRCSTVATLPSNPRKFWRWAVAYVVLAVFQGHDHPGAHTVQNGIHYYTLKAIVEGSGAENNAYAVVEVHGGRVSGSNQSGGGAVFIVELPA